MTARSKAATPILNAVHETARDLRTAGFIDKRRMREYDALCVATVPAYSSTEARQSAGPEGFGSVDLTD